MLGRPVFLLLIGLTVTVIGASAVFIFGKDVVRSMRCTATTKGILYPNFTVIQHKKNGSVRSEDFEVDYRFEVDGEQFVGDDILKNRPASLNAMVRYDPNEPSNNELERARIIELVMALFFIIGGIYVAFFSKAGDTTSSVPA